MERSRMFTRLTLPHDIAAGFVMFAVAAPLSLGIAKVSGAPPFAGLLTAMIGGIVVGLLSGSHTCISGPTAGLTAVVALQISGLGSFETFLLAVVVAGLMQLALAAARTGVIGEYIPRNVVRGLLAAVGLILILKQIPHMFGHDIDPEGEMSFLQPDHKNTFSELAATISNIHVGATVVGLVSLAAYFFWHRSAFAKRLPIPAALVVLILGIALNLAFRSLGGAWVIENNHLIQIPSPKDWAGWLGFLRWPDFSQWNNPDVYVAALIIAAVASFESLLNVEAIDTMDPQQRVTPPNRELFAQGVGNMLAGLVGGIPMTSVTVNSAVCIQAGSHTRVAAILHGFGLLVFVTALPHVLGLIPVACLAAVLFATGVRLIDPASVQRMWNDGRYQFAPFVATVAAIVLTDLLTGVLIGLAVSFSFILNSNLRRPIRRFVEKRLGGNIIHIELANQVSFLNRPALSQALDAVPRGGQLLIDAQNTDYVDPDVLDLIRTFCETTGPARRIEVSLTGFRSKYRLQDRIQFLDHSTLELQRSMSPAQVLQVLKDGHQRFRTGRRLTRDLSREVHVTAQGQHPLAVVLSCMDSRSSAELIFDVGVGDIFSVRVAGNILSRKILGSLEYACEVAGAKLILVMGHTRCGAVTAAVKLAGSNESVAAATGCQHVEFVVQDIRDSIEPADLRRYEQASEAERQTIVDDVARANVRRAVLLVEEQSDTLRQLTQQGRIVVVGALYDVATGNIEFLDEVDQRPEQGLEMSDAAG